MDLVFAWLFKADVPLAAICKQILGVIVGLCAAATAHAQSFDIPVEPSDPPPNSGSTTPQTPSNGTTVEPNITQLTVDFQDPRRSNVSSQATDAVGNTSIDFGNLGVNPADLGGQNALPADLMNFETNPDALNDALGDGDLTDLVNSAFDNDVGGDAFEDWVSSIMGSDTDPFEVTGLDPSTPSTSCTTETSTRERVERSSYSCSVDDGSNVENPTCERVLVHPTDDDYVYACGETRATAADDWSGQCEPFENDQGCEQTGEVCNEEVQAVPATYSCERGQSVEYVESTCEERLEHELDPDYSYECTRSWVNGAWEYSQECEALSDTAGCVGQGSSCTGEGGPQTEGYTCENIPGIAASTEACHADLQVAVDQDYVYGCIHRWNANAREWEEVNPEVCSVAPSQCVLTESGSCTEPSGPAIEDRFCEVGGTAGQEPTSCNQDRYHQVDLNLVYSASETYDPDGDTWVRSLALQALAGSSACTQTGTVCDEGREYSRFEQTCRTGMALGSEQRSCRLPLEHNIDVNYVYQCERRWNSSSQAFEVSAECQQLETASSCNRLVENCTTPAPPIFEDYSCRVGNLRVQRDETVNRSLRIEVDQDYIYRGYRDWVEGSQSFSPDRTVAALTGNSSCSQVASSCVTDSPGVFSTHTCDTGYRINQDQRTCAVPRTTAVDVDYSYEARRVWDANQNAHVATWENNRLQERNCTLTSSRCSTRSPGVFTQHSCQTGYRDNTVNRSCQTTRNVVVDLDYEYRANRTWNGSRWSRSGALNTLSSRAGCSESSVRCTQASPGVFSYHHCRTGYRDIAENRTCDRPRVVTVDPDFEYVGRRNWNESRHAGDSAWNTLNGRGDCRRTGSTCSRSSPGVYSTYTCEQGTQRSTTNRTCDEVLNVSATPRYRYSVSYFGNALEPDFNPWEGIFNPSNGCQAQGAPSCSGGGFGGFGRNFGRQQCTQTYICTASSINGLNGVALSPIVNTSWNTSQCNQHSSCAQTNRVCVEGAGTRTINGVRVYQTCWRYQRTYSCATSTPVNTCSPPSGAQHVRDTCLRADGGTCGLTRREYRVPQPDPSGGCHQYRETFRCENAVGGLSATRTIRDVVGETTDNRQCNSVTSGGGCSQTNEVCVEGAATRNINGLNVYRSCWKWRRTYSCTRRETTNTCNPPSGSTLTVNNCVWRDGGGTCRLYDRTYRREEHDPSGGCHAYEHRFRCEETVSGLSAARTFRHVLSDAVDVSQCNASINYSTCSQTREVCIEDAGTRRINGLSVHRSCWKWRRDFSCTERENINTCTPPSGSTLKSQSCVWSDSGGTCRLFARTYEREETDPSGGCHEFSDRFRCENTVGLVGAIVETHRDIIRNSFNRAACAPHETDANCRRTGRRCVSGPETRNINGLDIYNDCWEEEDIYTCDVRQDINTCTPPAGAQMTNTECVWSDAGGTCRLHRQTWTREEADPSGGCHRYEDRFLCEEYIGGIPLPVETLRSIASENLDHGSEVAALEAQQCTEVRRECIAGPATRTIGGLSVTRDCWQWRYHFTCEDREAYNGCAPASNCSIAEEVCVDHNADGSCMLTEKRYRCETEDASGGCHVFTSDYRCEEQTANAGPIVREIRTASEGVFNNAQCVVHEGDVGCQRTSTRCVDSEPQTRTVDGVSITSSCWEHEHVYTCETQTPLDDCGGMQHCDQVSEVCATTAADGSCATYERTYSCEQEDASGRCARRTSTFTCQQGVAGAGAPDRLVVAGVGAAHWDQACTANYADDACEIVSERCLQGPATREIRPLISLAELQADEALAALLGLQGVSVGSGHPAEVIGSGGMFRVQSSLLEAYSAHVDCARREVAYSCGVITSINTCGEIDPGYASSQAANGGAKRSWFASTLVAGPMSGQAKVFSVALNDGTPLAEGEIGQCTFQDEVCQEIGSDGACIRWRRRYSCEVGDGSEGCAERTDLYRCEEEIPGATPIEIIGEVSGQSWNWQGCEALDAVVRCSPVGDPYCSETDPRVREVDGVQAEADCWRMTQDYACTAVEASTTCDETSTGVCENGGAGSSGTGGQVSQSIGSDGVATIDGTERPETLAGGPAEDRIRALGGNDVINGGAGIDVAIFRGSYTDYSVQVTFQAMATVSGGVDGFNQLSGVEFAYFEGDNRSIPLMLITWDINEEPRLEFCRIDEWGADCGGVSSIPNMCEYHPELCGTGPSQPQTPDPEPARCDVNRRCELAETTCVETDVTGACLREERRYTCEVFDAAGGCSQATDTYLCEEPVDAAGTPSDITVEITGSQWVSVNCPQAERATCEPVEPTICVDEWLSEREPVYVRWPDDEYRSFIGPLTNYPNVRVNGCQRRERTYSCAEYSDATTCEPPDESCLQISANCAETNRYGTCIREAIEYECTARPAGCVDRTRTFRCEDLVDGGGQPSDIITEVGDPYWEEHCDEFDDPDLECTRQEPVCTHGAGVRRIAEQEIFAECWREEIPVTCDGVGEVRTDCDPPDHCVLEEEVCLDEPQIGACRSLERRYRCEETVTEDVTEERCGSEVTCFGGTCVETEREQSTNMPDALARLAALGQAHETEGNTASSLSLMGGDALRCHKSGIWKNCCTNGGEGIAVDWLGGSCNEQEQELAHRTAENQCVEVGWYCSKKGWFGCRKRSRTSCCFGSELARIVNEAGRDQLGLDWGTPREPNCAGLTPQQFSQVDLSNVDMSALFDDVVEGFAPDGQGSVQSRIQDRLQNFYSTGSSGLGSGSSGTGGSSSDGGGN